MRVMKVIIGARSYFRGSLFIGLGVIIWVMAALILGGCNIGGSVSDRVEEAQNKNDAPPIWVVKDEDSTLYLYGTLHLLPLDLDWQKEDMREAFGGVGTVFFELDTSTQAQLSIHTLTQQLGFLESGQRLIDQFDPYQLKLMEAAAHNGNFDINLIDNMQPWLASEFLTLIAATDAGLSADISADEALKSRASRLGKNIIYLDGAEDQIRASADLPHNVQMTMLSDTLEQFSRLGTHLSSLVDDWIAGDVKSLKAQSVDIIQSRAPEFYHALIVQRNRRWADELVRFLNGSGDGFVAVGISHLLGEESLQNMLREEGYSVSRYYAFQGEQVIRPINLAD